jgi:Ca2+-binding RTX toxin-like protein
MLANVSLSGGELRIVGGPNNDVLTLSANSVGGPIDLVEDDVVVQSFQSDDISSVAFYGGAGNDTLFLFGNVVVSETEFATETAFSRLDSIRFYGGEGDDFLQLRFSDYSDKQITGIGGAGDDVMVAFQSDESLTGSGNASTRLRFYGNDGADELRVRGLAEGEIVVVGGEGSDSIVGSRAADRLFGGDGNDSIFGGEGNDRLIGGDGDDRLEGFSGDDVIIDSLGNDTLSGDDGNDWIFGGAGDDSINGGEGDDQLLGGDDDDYLYGNGGNDRLVGGKGEDRGFGGDGADRLLGNADNDLLSGGAGDDFVNGGNGDDHLGGGEGADRLVGGQDNDRLEGNAGDDTLIGNDGIDQLLGHVGADYLSGGAGNDTLNFGIDTDVDRGKGESGIDFFVQNSSSDKLIDFVSGEDTQSPMVDLEDGVSVIADRATFNVLAKEGDINGATDVPEVKFLITGVDTDSPTLHFINSNNHLLQFDYWSEVLGNEFGVEQFDLETYFTNDDRVNVAGSIVAHDDYLSDTQRLGLYTIDFLQTDAIAFEYVEKAYQLIAQRAPILAADLAVHLSSDTLRDAVAAEQSLYDNSDVVLIDSIDLFA